MNGEELRCRSFEFAKQIVSAYRYLIEDKKEFILSKLSIGLDFYTNAVFWKRRHSCPFIVNVKN